MTHVIAVDRTTIRRNITLTGRPQPELIDALVRTGFQFDEKAQQWWKVENAAAAPSGDELLNVLDDQHAALREQFDLPKPEKDEHQRRYQSYYTPADLAAELVEVAGVKEGHDCLEPSAGYGDLAKQIAAKGGDVTVVEADPEAVAWLKKTTTFHTHHADFLRLTPASFDGFDRIVMNPPFSRDQDARHVCHAFRFLKPGGKLVAIVGSYALNGRTDDRRKFAEAMNRFGRVVRDVPPGTFDNNARAVVVELVKPSDTAGAA